jgi:hypothetical protein
MVPKAVMTITSVRGDSRFDEASARARVEPAHIFRSVSTRSNSARTRRRRLPSGGLVHLVIPAPRSHGQGGAHVALIVDDKNLGIA